MKAKAGDLKAALRDPPPHIRLFLFHGPDEAQARDLARQLSARLGGSLVELMPGTLASDPARLADEAAAVSMFGDRNVLRVAGAGDAIAEAIELLLIAPAAGNPVVMTAGALKASSKLLGHANDSPAAFAYACYPAEGRDLAALGMEMARERGLSATPQVMAALVEAVGGERGVLAQELEKLALYLDAAPEAVAALEVEHLRAVAAASGEADTDALIEALTAGKPGDAARQLVQLAAEGVGGITLLRAAGRRIAALADARAAVEAGRTAEAAVAALRPPLFWKDRPAFIRALGRWSSAELATARARLLEAERAIKAPGSAGDVLASAALLEVARS